MKGCYLSKIKILADRRGWNWELGSPRDRGADAVVLGDLFGSTASDAPSNCIRSGCGRRLGQPHARFGPGPRGRAASVQRVARGLMVRLRPRSWHGKAASSSTSRPWLDPRSGSRTCGTSTTIAPGIRGGHRRTVRRARLAASSPPRRRRRNLHRATSIAGCSPRRRPCCRGDGRRAGRHWSTRPPQLRHRRRRRGGLGAAVYRHERGPAKVPIDLRERRTIRDGDPGRPGRVSGAD